MNSSRSTIREEVCSFSNLHKALCICSVNVRWKDSVMRFSQHSLSTVMALKESLDDGTYKLSPYTNFVIHEPKTRLITSTRFKDRIFQRSLCDNYVYKELTKDFLPTNFACQVDKGTDRARECLKSFMRQFHSSNKLNGFYLKVDLHDYFGSTTHTVAKAAVSKRVPDKWARDELFKIIDSFNPGTGKGIGLGSQVSQLIQLAVLDDLDHFIVEQLGIKYYLRYMDDFILLHPSQKYLKECLARIKLELDKLELTINEKKTMIQPLKHPIKFLGFSFLLHPTGRVTCKLLPKNYKAEKRKLRKLVKLIDDGALTLNQVNECFKSWWAHANKTDSRGMRLRMRSYYQSLLENSTALHRR